VNRTYSIQGADFEVREESEWKTPHQMVALFSSYDWKQELELQNNLEAGGKDNCPPGLILVREIGIYLQLCPNGDGTVYTHCIQIKPSKLLGLFKTMSPTDVNVPHLDHDLALRAIPKFMANDEDWLQANINENGAEA